MQVSRMLMIGFLAGKSWCLHPPGLQPTLCHAELPRSRKGKRRGPALLCGPSMRKPMPAHARSGRRPAGGKRRRVSGAASLWTSISLARQMRFATGEIDTASLRLCVVAEAERRDAARLLGGGVGAITGGSAKPNPKRDRRRHSGPHFRVQVSPPPRRAKTSSSALREASQPRADPSRWRRTSSTPRSPRRQTFTCGRRIHPISPRLWTTPPRKGRPRTTRRAGATPPRAT